MRVGMAAGSLLWAGGGVGAEEPTPARPRVPEVVEMAWSIVRHGAEMGPGTGWFHPSRARHDFAWLAARRDADGDGRVTAEELGVAAEWFGVLDRDGDGAIDASDLDWSSESAYLRTREQARSAFNRLDPNSNGRITREEWDRLFEKAAGERGYLTPEDLARTFYAAPTRPKGPPGPGEGPPSRWTLLKGLASGEIGSPFEGPMVDAKAPDFELSTFALDRRVRLSELRGRPVVLLFGSFT